MLNIWVAGLLLFVIVLCLHSAACALLLVLVPFFPVFLSLALLFPPHFFALHDGIFIPLHENVPR